MRGIRFFIPNLKEYKKRIEKDYEINSAFRGGELTKDYLNGYEWQFIKCYRHFQVNQGTIWQKYYSRRLRKIEKKTGICLENNCSIGDGLIIGHWGKIVINGEAKFGSQFMVTHGVTIGRDIRGKRNGVPSFGDRVCIRANSTVVGNISVGNDVLIAPNTFVNFDVPDHSIVIGNPATVHRRENATEGHLPKMNWR